MKLSGSEHFAYRPVPAVAARLKPNIFARIVRLAWNHAAKLGAFWLLLSGLSIFLVLAFGHYPHATRLPLPLASISAAPVPAEFANIANLQTVSLANDDSETLIRQLADLTTALRERTEIYQLVFAPGTQDFYDDYSMLFRPLDDIKNRVAYAISLKPLFDAIAEAPNAQSMTTLVGEIAGAVQQGRSSSGVADLLNEAANAVQALANGEDKPLDWSKVASLSIPVNSTAVTLLALPKAGQEDAARNTTSKLLEVLRSTSATKAQLTQAGLPPTKAVSAPADRLRVSAATLIGLAFIGLLMAVFVGQMPLLLLILFPAAIFTAPIIAVFMFIAPDSWSNFWPAIFTIIFDMLLFNVHVLLRLAERAGGKRVHQSDLMLLAHQQGKIYALFAVAVAAPWFVLAMMQSPALLLPGIAIGLFSLAVPLCSLTALITYFRFFSSPINWQAKEWIEPAHRALFETRYWQIAAPALGGLIVFASIVSAVLSRGNDVQIPSDANVSIVAQNVSEVETIITRLKSFSGARAVRWIGMFVPPSEDEKRAALHALADQFPRITPIQSEPPTDLRDQIDAMQESLKRIALLAVKDKSLADAADQFRRSLALLNASDRDQPITQLEHRLFGGFNRLADRAAQLSSLAPVDIETLPTELQALFGHGAGPFRIEVDAAPDISNERLAVGLDQAGFNVLHPAVLQSRFVNQQIRSILQVVGLAICFTLAVLILTFRESKRWLGLVLLTAASIAVACAVNTVSHPDYNLIWLISVMALLSCFVGIVHVAMLRHQTNAASFIEVFMLPSIALAGASAYFALGVEVIAKEAMPLSISIFLMALVISLFHHHSRAPTRRSR